MNRVKSRPRLALPLAVVGLCALPLVAHAGKDKRDKDDKNEKKSESRSVKSIDERQKKQSERIRQGRERGDLTRSETGKLRQREAQIRAAEKDARRSDGTFSDAEKQNIKNQLQGLDQDIRRQYRNRDRDEKRFERYDQRYGPDYTYGSGGHRYDGTYYSPGSFPGGYYPDGHYPGSPAPTVGYPGGYSPGTGSKEDRRRDRRYPTGRYPGGYYPDPNWPGTSNLVSTGRLGQNWDRARSGMSHESGTPRSGETLDLGEAAILRDRKARIQTVQTRLREGAQLTPAERYGLERELDDLRRDVSRYGPVEVDPRIAAKR